MYELICTYNQINKHRKMLEIIINAIQDYIILFYNSYRTQLKIFFFNSTMKIEQMEEEHDSDLLIRYAEYI